MLFNVDNFEFEEFVFLIPNFLQFGIDKINLKVIKKIKQWIENEKIFETNKLLIEKGGKSEVYRIDVADKNLLQCISVNIPDDPSVTDLQNVVLCHFRKYFTLNRKNIGMHICSLNTIEEIRDYLFTLLDIDENIFSFIKNTNIYFKKYDDLIIHFIDNFNDMETIQNRYFVSMTLEHSSENVIEYLLNRKNIFNYANVCENALYKVCERGFHNLIKLLIDTTNISLLKYDRNGKTPLMHILQYSTPSVLKYALQKIPFT